MDPDRQRLINAEIKIIKQSSNMVPNDGDVLPSLWIRRIIQSYTGLDAFLLDYGFNFLPYIGIFFYFAYIVTKIS